MRFLIYLCVAVLMVVGGQLSSLDAVTDEGLILYFGFDKEVGGSVLDGSDGGNDGLLTDGASITTDEKYEGIGALEILDQNSSVQVDSFAELAAYQDNTYLFWINFIQGSNGAWSQIIAKPAPGEDRSPGIWIRPAELGIHYRFNPGNGGADYVGPEGNNTQFAIGEWYHVAGVKEGGTLTFYTGGVSRGTYGVPATHAQGADKMYIGKSPRYRAATFYLDELYVFDRALSQQDVVDVMEGTLLPVEPKDKLATTWGKLKAK